MNNFEALAAENIIKSQIGSKAYLELKEFKGITNSPLDYILAEANELLIKKPAVYYIYEGMPENFYLSGFSFTPIAYSLRYLQFVQVTLNLFSGVLTDLRTDISSRIFLRFISERALRENNSLLAVRTFLKSREKQTITVSDEISYGTLEDGNLDELYMIRWFFTLAHELGHQFIHEKEMDLGSIISDDQLLSVLKTVLEQTVPPEEVLIALQKATTNEPGFILGINSLRSEGFSDILATKILIMATNKMMIDLGQAGINISRFLWYFFATYHTFSLIENCNRISSIAPSISKSTLFEANNAITFHSISFVIRLWMVKASLPTSLSSIYGGDQDSWSQFMDSTEKELHQAYFDISKGLNTAMKFAFSSEDDLGSLLSSLKKQAKGFDLVERVELENFIMRADSIGSRGKALDELRSILKAN